MEDLLISLYVIAVTMIVIIVIFVLTKKSKYKKEVLIKQCAESKGWEYSEIRETNAWGTILETPDWRFEIISRSHDSNTDHSSDIDQKTRWISKNLKRKTENFIIIGPRSTGKLTEKSDHFLIQKAASYFLREDSNNVHEISMPLREFNQKYMVLTNQVSFASSLISSALQRELLQWDGKKFPVIKVNKHGISIEIDGVCIDKIDKISDLINMGEILRSNIMINHF